MPSSPVYISRPPAGFSALAVLRGLQLTFLGAVRALKNPYLIESGYYQRAGRAIGVSFIIQIILWVPIWILQFVVWCLMLVASESVVAYLRDTVDALEFIENNVLNVGLFLVSAVRFFQPEMDNMFLMSLQFVDSVYKKKHPESTRSYYSNLTQSHGHHNEVPQPFSNTPVYENQTFSGTPVYGNQTINEGYSQLGEKTFSDTPVYGSKAINEGYSQFNEKPPLPPRPSEQSSSFTSQTKQIDRRTGSLVQVYIKKVTTFWKNNKGFGIFIQRSLKRSAFSLGVYFLSGLPVIGRFVTPAVSFYSFNNVVGTPTALGIFAIGLAIKKRYMFMFLSTFWGGRSLVHGLLAPYFARVPFTKPEREQWFKAREGIMFGFGCGFYWVMKTPFIGVLAYGIAEASAAYLITKVSDPLPPPGPELNKWVETELTWTKQDTFLSGVTLDTDGFGDATPIVPGSWVSSNSENPSAVRTVE